MSHRLHVLRSRRHVPHLSLSGGWDGVTLAPAVRRSCVNQSSLLSSASERRVGAFDEGNLSNTECWTTVVARYGAWQWSEVSSTVLRPGAEKSLSLGIVFRLLINHLLRCSVSRNDARRFVKKMGRRPGKDRYDCSGDWNYSGGVCRRRWWGHHRPFRRCEWARRAVVAGVPRRAPAFRRIYGRCPYQFLVGGRSFAPVVSCESRYDRSIFLFKARC